MGSASRWSAAGNAGTQSVNFSPNLPKSATYEVWVYKLNYSDPAVQIDITHKNGNTHLVKDWTKGSEGWVSLGIYDFDVGKTGKVLIYNGTDKKVFALIACALLSRLC